MSAFNGSGTFVISGTGLPFVTGTTISSTVGNQLNTDLATGLSTTITKDGQTTPTANLPMGGFHHTTVSDATARNQYASMGQLQDRVGAYAVAGGTVDAITATFSPAYTALTDGMQIIVKAAGANATTTPTLAINGLTATTITKFGGKALQAGDIYGAGHELELVYSSTGTRWELINPSHVQAGVGFKGYLNAATQSISPSTLTPIALDAEVQDYGGFFNTTTGRYVPLIAGMYWFAGRIELASLTTAGAVSLTTILKNGTIELRGNTLSNATNGTFNGVVSGPVFCNGSTDYIQLAITQTNGGSLNVGGGDVASTFMAGFLVFPT